VKADLEIYPVQWIDDVLRLAMAEDPYKPKKSKGKS